MPAKGNCSTSPAPPLLCCLACLVVWVWLFGCWWSTLSCSCWWMATCFGEVQSTLGAGSAGWGCVSTCNWTGDPCRNTPCDVKKQPFHLNSEQDARRTDSRCNLKGARRLSRSWVLGLGCNHPQAAVEADMMAIQQKANMQFGDIELRCCATCTIQPDDQPTSASTMPADAEDLMPYCPEDGGSDGCRFLSYLSQNALPAGWLHLVCRRSVWAFDGELVKSAVSWPVLGRSHTAAVKQTWRPCQSLHLSIALSLRFGESV